MQKNPCIMQVRAETAQSALPIRNYSQILYQFFEFTQNLKRSYKKAARKTFTFHYVSIKTYPEELKEAILSALYIPLCIY